VRQILSRQRELDPGHRPDPGKPLDYRCAGSDIQMYAGVATRRLTEPPRRCARHPRAAQCRAVGLQPKTKLLYVPRSTACAEVTQIASSACGPPKTCASDRVPSRSTATKPRFGDRSLDRRDPRPRPAFPYPNYSGAVATAAASCSRGFTTGPLWRSTTPPCSSLEINFGVGFDSPPMTVRGRRQAICGDPLGLSRISSVKHVTHPNRDSGAAQPTMLFVFGLLIHPNRGPARRRLFGRGGPCAAPGPRSGRHGPREWAAHEGRPTLLSVRARGLSNWPASRAGTRIEGALAAFAQ